MITQVNPTFSLTFHLTYHSQCGFIAWNIIEFTHLIRRRILVGIGNDLHACFTWLSTHRTVIVRFANVPDGHFLDEERNRDQCQRTRQIDTDLLAIFAHIAQQISVGIRCMWIITTLDTKRTLDRLMKLQQSKGSYASLVFDPSVIVWPNPRRLGRFLCWCFFIFINDSFQSNVIAFRRWALSFTGGIN